MKKKCFLFRFKRNFFQMAKLSETFAGNLSRNDAKLAIDLSLEIYCERFDFTPR